jgi:DNA-binding beta-propeller fold protein YncE
VDRPLISRRALLLGAAAAAGCSHQKATGFRGYCFVANQGGRSVAVVDLTRFRLRKQIPLDAAPSQIIAHPSQPKILAFAPDAGAIYDIDPVKLDVVRRATAGTSAVGMQLNAAHDTIWAPYRNPAALVGFPLASFKPERRIKLPNPPDVFDLCDQGLAAVASIPNRELSIVSLASGSVVRTIPTGDEPSMIAFRKDGRHIFIASRPERVLRIVAAADGDVRPAEHVEAGGGDFEFVRAGRDGDEGVIAV